MKGLILVLFFLVNSIFAFSQTNADLVGKWYSAKDDIIITIFEDGQKISGKITWMKSPNDRNRISKTDLLNPDEGLRGASLQGMIILSNFSHIAGNVWDNGSLYVYEEGKTYSGMIRLKNKNTLNLRGYIGFSFFERYTSNWTRYVDVVDITTKKRNLLIQLTDDVAKILERIEKEDLFVQLRDDLAQILERIEKLKKAE